MLHILIVGKCVEFGYKPYKGFSDQLAACAGQKVERTT